MPVPVESVHVRTQGHAGPGSTGTGRTREYGDRQDQGVRGREGGTSGYPSTWGLTHLSRWYSSHGCNLDAYMPYVVAVYGRHRYGGKGQFGTCPNREGYTMWSQNLQEHGESPSLHLFLISLSEPSKIQTYLGPLRTLCVIDYWTVWDLSAVLALVQ